MRYYLLLALVAWLLAMLVALHPATPDDFRLILAVPFIVATTCGLEKGM